MNKDSPLNSYVKQEFFYKAVVEDGSDTIFIVDYDGHILYHNPAVYVTLGYPNDSLIGKIFFDYINPEFRKKFIKEFGKCTKLPYSKNIEFHFRKADQSYRYLEFNAINLQHKEGIKGFILDCRDIEQRKRDAEELIRAKNTKEKFLANMSHEIRTPINGIAGMVNLLSGTNPSVEQQKFLSAIKNSSDNLKVIVNDILDLSAIESGKLSLEKIGFKVSSLVKDVVEIFQYQSEEKKIKLNYKILEEGFRISRDDYYWKIIDQRGLTMMEGDLLFRNGRITIDTDDIPNGLYHLVMGVENKPLMYRKIAIMHR